MRTRVTRRHWEGVAAALLMLGGISAGCGVLDGSQDPDSSSQVEQELDREVTQLLRARARAVRRDDVEAFLDGVVDDPALRHNQREYFDNLQQLPIEKFGYAVDTVSTGGGTVSAEVDVLLRLVGYDDAAVRTPGRLSFVREQDGVLRLSELHDADYEAAQGVSLQPWDVAPVEVIEGDGVLGIFDRGSSYEGQLIVEEVEDAIDQVSADIPVAWSRQVVVYALSNTQFLAGLRDLPGGDPERLDGVAFPVAVAPSSEKYVGTRFLLHPRILERDRSTRSRLIRHELVHVALGRLDDRIPTWLSEGLAEHVSVRPLAPEDRLISRDAVRAAQRGLQQLPDDGTFNGDRSAQNYGISWYVCEYITGVYGEARLWALFDEMRADGGTATADQDEVLLSVLGVDGESLARAAGQRILSTFG